MEYASILVTVYDRLEHLRNCIESLKSNAEAKDSVLYIASDFYAKPKHREAVTKVREYILNIDGFKDIRPIFNKVNYGAHNSICNAINKVFSENERLIFMEDDIIVSPYFLKYINEGLDLYQNRKSIFAICGFTYNDLKLPRSYNFDTYLWSRNCPWGFGTWKDRWYELDLELKDYPAFISNTKEVRRFMSIAPSSLNVLKADREGLINALDVRISFNMFLKNQYSVFPVESMVVNTGFDGSGVNCENNRRLADYFANSKLRNNPIKHENKIEPNSYIYKARRKKHTSIKNDYLIPILKQNKVICKLAAIIKQIKQKKDPTR